MRPSLLHVTECGDSTRSRSRRSCYVRARGVADDPAQRHDRWNLAQITCVGTEEPHLILGAYRIPSNQDASLASFSLGVLVQNGAPSGGLRLRPFQPGSNLVKTESENLTERAREDRDDSWHSEDSE